MTNYNTQNDARVEKAMRLSEAEGIRLRHALSQIMGGAKSWSPAGSKTSDPKQTRAK
jgi:hypothetical protein